jgi:glycosyltransferase involved in cell wall biosynthesis
MSDPGSSPRVLHVDTATELRGGQQQLAYLLAARPCDAWAGPPDAPLARIVGPPAVVLRPGNDPRNLLTLRAVARSFDVIAAHTPHAHVSCTLVHVPVVVHRRVDFAIRHPGRYRRAAAVIAVSEGVRAALARGGIVERVHVVHDGVAIPPDEGPLPDGGAPRPWWGAVGALVAHKGHAHLVDAMVDVPGTLFLVGEGPLRGALEARARARGVAERVRFCGEIRPIGALLRALDVFVHPSVEEGFGQVIVEALGAGCTVVATRAGGAPEAVGTAGGLVAPADARSLADAMRAALTTRVPSEQARAQAERFSVARMVEGTVRVYASVAPGAAELSGRGFAR